MIEYSPEGSLQAGYAHHTIWGRFMKGSTPIAADASLKVAIQRRGSFLQSFGPGLIWAGTAIGVSHLVQSTRAGADLGFGLAGVILLALVLKYPFFEFAPRFAAATGMSLVEGYRHIGRWALWLYVGMVLSTAVITQTAIVLLTAFLFMYAFGVAWPAVLAAVLIYTVCGLLLWAGRFRALDLTIKLMLAGLAISTLIAATMVLPRADFSTFSLGWPAAGSVSFGFLLALMGWMPSDITASVFHSIWMVEKDRSSGVRVSVATARLDFLVGYLGTGALAFAFVLLGTAVMYGSGVAFSPEGPAFATQLVDLYAATIGGWIRPVILVLVLTTMFSTALAVLDGFPRVIERAINLIRTDDPALTARSPSGALYWIAFGVLGASMILVLLFFSGSLTTMIDFATTVAFLTGPVFGYLNLRAVTSPEVPEEHRPGVVLRAFSYAGLLLLSVIAVAFLLSMVTG
ncbi:MAG: divalent metal cation transporter [Gemmatimonadota bacterium]